MFEPGAPIDEVERDVESIIMALVHELGERAEARIRSRWARRNGPTSRRSPMPRPTPTATWKACCPRRSGSRTWPNR